MEKHVLIDSKTFHAMMNVIAASKDVLDWWNSDEDAHGQFTSLKNALEKFEEFNNNGY